MRIVVAGMAVALGCGGCGEKEPERDRVAAEARRPAVPELDLTIGGAVTRTIKGKGGRCGAGVNPGFLFAVESSSGLVGGHHGEWDLGLNVEQADRWELPSLLFDDHSAPGLRFVWSQGAREESKADRVQVDRRDGVSFRIDATLINVMGKDAPLHVTGTIRCPG